MTCLFCCLALIQAKYFAGGGFIADRGTDILLYADHAGADHAFSPTLGSHWSGEHGSMAPLRPYMPQRKLLDARYCRVEGPRVGPRGRQNLAPIM